MIDPLQMLNNDMSKLTMSVNPIMENWRDDNANRFNNECMCSVRNRYNRYVNNVNHLLRTFMQYENRCNELMKRMENLK